MRILVTNDDGIAAPGIAALARFAVRLGEVTVIAPGASRAEKVIPLTLFRRLK